MSDLFSPHRRWRFIGDIIDNSIGFTDFISDTGEIFSKIS